VARLRALRRRASAQPAPILSLGEIRIDTAARRVFRRDVEIELTGREYAVLEILVRARGAVVTRTQISDHLYNDAAEVFSNPIDVHVAALRRKLGGALIQTRRGIGYLIE
jgi:two-component system OmpR family response regulator